MQHWTAPRRAEPAIDQWAVTRLHDESYELNALQRQAADEQAARNNPSAWLDARQHGTEGCADTSDDSSELGEGGLIACMLVVACVAVAVLAAYLQWSGA